jgi:hypothetical protein
MAVGVELIEVDVAVAGAGRAVGLDGNADEAELEAAFPRGTGSHEINSLGHLRVGQFLGRGCRRDDKIPVMRQPS